MGFLQLTPDTPPDFTQAVIAIKFRIPSASITAASGKFPSPNDGFPFWLCVIPLLTWGPQTAGDQVPIEAVLLGNESGVGDIYGTQLGSSWSSPQGPSYIGIRCVPEQTPVLEVLLQTDTPAACDNTRYIADGYNYNPSPPSYDLTYSDASSIDEGYNDYFGGLAGYTEITADTDHVLIISWDLSGGSASQGSGTGSPSSFAEGVDNYSMMWMSLDDVNFTGAELPMSWPGDDFDVNGHVSSVVATYSGAADNPIGTPATLLTGFSIPTSPISIPGPASINIGGSGAISDAPVLKYQVTAMQVFTGVTLDTSVEENRRVFFDSDGTPSAPSVAAAHFAKSPDILFITADDWMTGNNRGTLGDFTPTGTISGFTP